MQDFSQFDDAELMREIRADNMFAFDALYGRYSKRLLKFAFSILKSVEEAENILQDVFLNLWEKRHNVEKDSSVRYYIFTITYNSAISIIRKKAREIQFLDYLKSLQDLNQDPPSLEFEFNELTKALNTIIDHLPQRQKEVYILHKKEGLKYQEIAKRLNISVNTIETHMSRALKTIHEKLGKSSLLAILFYSLFV
jgi:RNA polymerase sigma-70 factor (ECF subfamily)